MNAPEIEHQDSRQTSTFSFLEENTDATVVCTVTPAINIIPFEDPLSEGNTVIEDATNISTLNTKSHCSFDAKDWEERLARSDLFTSAARSHSCDGRVEAQSTAAAPLQWTTNESKRVLRENLPSSPPDEIKKLETPFQAKTRGSLVGARLASRKSVADVRSVSKERQISQRDQPSSSSIKHGCFSHGGSQLGSMKIEHSQSGQVSNVSKEALPIGVFHLARQSGSDKSYTSVLEVFNKLLRGCDAVHRYNANPTTCLATNKVNGERCKRFVCDKETCTRSAQKIQCILNDMAKLHVTQKEVLSAQSLLRQFVDLTVCSSGHRKEYYMEITLLKDGDLKPVPANNNSDQIKAEEVKAESKPYDSGSPDTAPESVNFVSNDQDEKSSDKDRTDQCARAEDGRDSIGPVISALEKFNGIFPHAEEWFNKMASKCLWQKADGKRCGLRIAAKNRPMIQDLLAVLATLSTEVHVLEVSNQMGKLADLTFCGQRHRQKARVKIEESLAGSVLYRHGESILGDIMRQGGNDVQDESVDVLLTTSPFKQGVVSDGTRDFLFESPRKGLSGTKPIISRKRIGKTLVRYVPDFKPYTTIESAKYNLSEWVQRQALRKLTKVSEHAEGYIYVYWNEALFGARKIGKSDISVDERLRQWEYKCKHAVKGLYCSPTKVPHVERLEKLIHAELREYRVYEPRCRGCFKQHREWFMDLPDHVLHETIEKWTNWMMQRPYEENEHGWFLGEIAEKALPDLCKQTNVVDTKAKREYRKPRARLLGRSFYPRAAKERAVKEKVGSAFGPSQQGGARSFLPQSVRSSQQDMGRTPINHCDVDLRGDHR